MKLEFVLLEELAKSGGELAAEDAAECTDGQEEAFDEAIHLEPVRARPPAGTT